MKNDKMFFTQRAMFNLKDKRVEDQKWFYSAVFLSLRAGVRAIDLQNGHKAIVREFRAERVVSKKNNFFLQEKICVSVDRNSLR